MPPLTDTPAKDCLTPLLLNPTEAARTLRISERSLYSLVQSGQLKPIRIGRSVRISLTELERFITEKTNHNELPPRASSRRGRS